MKFIKTIFARQFRRPSGLLGHYAARFMRQNNQDYYRQVIELLQIQANDTVLEIGCGEGLAIKLITDHNQSCGVDGIDFSALMVKKAIKTNSPSIKDGRVRLFSGNMLDFDFGDKTYSKIFAINVIYFWEDLATPFAKILSLLKSQGQLVLFMSGPERLNQIPFAVDSVFNKYTVEHVQTELSRTGFSDISCDTVSKGGNNTYYISATKS
jgi:ubiquinone/menaquinone biosynthesis C-methylase UbiE